MNKFEKRIKKLKRRRILRTPQGIEKYVEPEDVPKEFFEELAILENKGIVKSHLKGSILTDIGRLDLAFKDEDAPIIEALYEKYNLFHGDMEITDEEFEEEFS